MTPDGVTALEGRVRDAERELVRAVGDLLAAERKLQSCEAALAKLEPELARERDVRRGTEIQKQRLEVALAKVRLALGETEFARIVST